MAGETIQQWFSDIDINYDSIPFIVYSVLIISVISLVAIWWLLRITDLPPGPQNGPITWIKLTFSKKYANNRFNDWCKEYGDLFRVRMGTKHVVVLNSVDVIKECYIKHQDAFSDRPKWWPATRLNQGLALGTRPYGKAWMRQRAFTSNVYRNSGQSRNVTLEESIQQEVVNFIGALKKMRGEAFHPNQLFWKPSVNVISNIMFNNQFDYRNYFFEKIIQRLNEFDVELKRSEPIFTYIPCMWYFMRSRKNALKVSYNNLTDSFSKIIEQQRSTYHNDVIRHGFDMFYREVKKKENRERSVFESDRRYNDSFLHSFVEQFYTGATPMAKAMENIFMQVAQRPELQEKIAKEVKEAVGQDKTPTVDDLDNLPLTNATVLEILRCYPVESYCWPRHANQSIPMNECTIPKGDVILANLNGILRDPRYWKNPDEFDPNRHIDKTSGKLDVNQALLPWSIGPRKCVGEIVARTTMVIMLAAVIQKFEIRPPKEGCFRYVMNGFKSAVLRCKRKVTKICALARVIEENGKQIDKEPSDASVIVKNSDEELEKIKQLQDAASESQKLNTEGADNAKDGAESRDNETLDVKKVEKLANGEDENIPGESDSAELTENQTAENETTTEPIQKCEETTDEYIERKGWRCDVM
ncbi:cytochrome P450 2C30-like [Saccoglossus kowalevskii]|uniref:Cytochrome P450 2C30-like n=1 Tax=Saccoglossus kowalevskii TaxID=10224 RepID=A0ABM0MTP8_SACKO|nr:PREDICTED: cytochrome P450 2C30-like [Saccoglossus kowalevskii]